MHETVENSGSEIMVEHTILIFPEFENIAKINKIREQYDPLAKLIRPHITLVYPFMSDLSDGELSLELSHCLSGCHKFQLKLNKISRCADQYGNYIFLNIKEGNKELELLHDRLYSGVLRKYKSGAVYRPHMTIGNLPSVDKMNEVYNQLADDRETYETKVSKVSVEEIGPGGLSIIIAEYELS